MDESKIALIISTATFLGAVISPIITSIFNYRCRIEVIQEAMPLVISFF